MRRIWLRHGLKPHRLKSFKLSNDPRRDALVLSLDESQIQALDRSQPGLPWKKGRCGTMTHDYKRHGTTTLFTALNTQDGNVKQLHLIMDNYAAHTAPEVQRWLTWHKRFHIH